MIDSGESISKLKVIIHSDFTSYPPEVLSQLEGHNACIWCIGLTPSGSSRPDYKSTTLDCTLSAARAFSTLPHLGNSPDPSTDKSSSKFVFCYLSGSWVTQATESGWKYGKGDEGIKALTEKGLVNLNSSTIQTYIFRPPLIVPNKWRPEIKCSIKLICGVLSWVLPSAIIEAPVLARAMLEVALNGHGDWEGKGISGDEGTFGTTEMKVLGAES